MNIADLINKRILPYKEFSIQSALSPEEVIKRIHLQTTKSGSTTFFPRKKIKSLIDKGYRYYGSTNVNQFSLSRIIDYKNSFLPQVEGVSEPAAHGSITTVEMKLPSIIRGFFLMLMGIFSFLILTTIIIPTVSISDKIIMVVLCSFFLFAVRGLVYAGFSGESRRSKQDLIKLLEGEEQ